MLSVLKSVTDVPDDGTFFTAYFDSERNAFVVLVKHDSFDSVPEGCRFPIDIQSDTRGVPWIARALNIVETMGQQQTDTVAAVMGGRAAKYYDT